MDYGRGRLGLIQALRVDLGLRTVTARACVLGFLSIGFLLIGFLLIGFANLANANDLGVINSGLDSPLMVDVRTQEEFNAGAIDGALSHPLSTLPNSLIELGIGQNDDIIVYCRSGRRSAQAKRRLEAAGFKRVFDGGGMQALEPALAGPDA